MCGYQTVSQNTDLTGFLAVLMAQREAKISSVTLFIKLPVKSPRARTMLYNHEIRYITARGSEPWGLHDTATVDLNDRRLTLRYRNHEPGGWLVDPDAVADTSAGGAFAFWNFT